jgi:malate dehydrogenase (oxaloacetate-decarboxylating)(NADP+)
MAVTKQQALEYHLGERPGKIEVAPSKPCRTQRDLSLAYTPGVAIPALRSKKILRTRSSTRLAEI